MYYIIICIIHIIIGIIICAENTMLYRKDNMNVPSVHNLKRLMTLEQV